MFRKEPSPEELSKEVEGLVGPEWDFSRYGFRCDRQSKRTLYRYYYCHIPADIEENGGLMSADDLLRVVRMLAAKGPETTFTILEKPAAIKVLESVTGAQAQLHWMQFGKWHLVFDDVYSAVNDPFNLSLGYSNGGDNFEVARLDNNHDDPMEFVSLGNLLALLEQAGLVKFRCGWCRTYQKLLRSCMGCERVRYCGKECQRADWMRHKSLCRKK
jgi:hypothetical protein